jgi:AcrR family transcriptional regulator
MEWRKQTDFVYRWEIMASSARRERYRETTKDEIKAIARQHMAAEGTAALSLRAIARDMEMTAPALYRYFPSRDELITALILEAFNALADAMESAAAQRTDAAVRLWDVIMAYRQWALEHPIDFQLIYGNPIPGYHAPSELTVRAAARAFIVVVNLLSEALAAGALKPSPEYETMPAAMHGYLAQLSQQDGYDAPPVILCIAAQGWSRMHGIIMLELFEHLAPVVGDVDGFFRFEMSSLFRSMGLTIP